ncbi:MAG: MBL fold metallo-hydrolase [Lentisphaerae bacterium]|nr:MBL fold metallo-hydrolase [Lentisphaerota bacterium]
MKIQFFGAAHTTTGSMHLVEANGLKILLDCGLYQGQRKEAFERNRNLPVNPAEIDYVLLSHAHIDHSGNLPTLARHGFRGKVISTTATRELCDVMLRDSAFLQKQDVDYVNKKRVAQGKAPFEPLYLPPDVDKIISQFQTEPLKRQVDLGNGVKLVMHSAGHILGSAIIQLDVTDATGASKRLVFTGDLGQPGQPIIRPADTVSDVDALIIESTYADREHPPKDDVSGRLKSYIEEIHQQKARLIIPAFSVGRTQHILYYLSELLEHKRIPLTPVFVDSPLSLKATKIYAEHRECYGDDASDRLRSGDDPLNFPGLKFIESVEESKALNALSGPMIIVSASGMCEGGRVLHHLKKSVSDPRNIILIVGYQAEHTLGRRIVEYQSPLRILGDEFELQARVHTINALSAHADRSALMAWLDSIKPTVKKAFAVHGDEDKVTAMVDLLHQHGVDEAVAPVSGQKFTL